MPIVPKGDNLGNARLQAGRTNIRGGNDPVAEAVSGLGREAAGIAFDINRENQNANRVNMSNGFLQRQKQIDSARNDLEQRLKMGDTDPDNAIEDYRKTILALPKPQVSGLSGVQQQEYDHQLNVIDYTGEKQVVGLQKTAVTYKAQNALEDTFNLNQEELLDPNSNFQVVRSAWDSDAVTKTGREAYGEKWGKVKQQYLTQLSQNYLQNRINYATDQENGYQLQQLKNDLLDDKKYTDLDALKRRQLINQIDPVLDRTIGINYGRSLSTNLTDLTALTGNYEAANVFNAMIQRESAGKQFDANGQPLTSSAGAIGKAQVMPETAKAMAKELGIAFDEDRYKNDAEYNVMLGQAYFTKNLKKYGSPLMAAAAYNAGDGAVDKWIKQFGDPRKGEISEGEFLAKIPYKETREYVQNVAGRVNRGRKTKIDKSSALAIIDNSDNLSYEQKQYARSELSKNIAIQEQQAQAQYTALRNSVWEDVYLNGVAVDQIDPQRYAALTVDDRIKLKKEAVRELDLPVWKEARGRVKAGESFDILNEYSAKLPPNNLKTLLDMQQDLANSADGAAGRARSEAFKIFSLDIQEQGIKNKGELAKIWDDVYSELDDFEQKNKRKATRQEILNITRRQFLDVQLDNGKTETYRKLTDDQRNRITGFDVFGRTTGERQAAASYFGLTASNDQVKSVKDIPPADKREIETVLKSLNVPITDDTILKYYYDGLNQ